MGAWILYIHIVLDGNSTVMQDRFQTRDACLRAAATMSREIGSDYGVRVKSSFCINDGTDELINQ
jgi:hypothetical protein